MTKYVHYSRQEHYLTAEKLISMACAQINDPQPIDDLDPMPPQLKLQLAQIHATLATATSNAGGDDAELRRSKLYEACDEDPSDWAMRSSQ